MRVLLRRGLSASVLMAALGLLMAPAPARGDLIIGDIAAGNNYGSGYYVGPGGGLNNAIAQGFTMSSSYDLNSVDLYLSNYTLAAGSSLRLSIDSDNGSNNPGVDLYDLSTNLTGTTSGTPTLASFSGTGSFTLAAGTKYWLDLYASNPSSSTGSSVLWVGARGPAFQQINPSGPGATDIGQLRSVGAGNPPTGTPSTSDLRTAFALNGTPISPVPEPSSLVLTLTGGLCLVTLARVRRRRATRG